MRFIEGDRIYLRDIRESDLTETYRGWMNDPEITRYFETRFFPCSQESFHDYWEFHHDQKDEPWLGIFIKADGKMHIMDSSSVSTTFVRNDEHIGNIKLGPIHWVHRRSDLSLWIGRKDLWGKGYGTEAIKLMADYAFSKLNLYKLTAGIYKGNIGSGRAFQNAGFRLEACLTKQVWCEGKWMDVILMVRFRNDLNLA